MSISRRQRGETASQNTSRRTAAETHPVPGQRWSSDTEPELGLGLVEEVTHHQLAIFFPASGERRRYARDRAPIRRVRFREGDSIRSTKGESMVVAQVEEMDGLLSYVDESGHVRIPEPDLSDSISFSKPEERLAQAQVDSSALFDLRLAALQHDYRIRQSEVAGFVGGRIDLIPHQLYIAGEVTKRYLPRVLLADEVGLGKTIEAGLILHRLSLTGRAGRILILVPESLLHQWFVEMLRRFNLLFTLVDIERCEAVAGANADNGRNPFLEEQRVICSTSFLASQPKWAELAITAGWDMLVVDEAHHLFWSPESVSQEYLLVDQLAQASPGVLLLTATPEQLGVTGHFARLRLLDPARYPDLQKFAEEHAGYVKVADLATKLSAGHPLAPLDLALLKEILPEQADILTDTLEQIMAGAPGAREQLLNDLLDRHGPGRVIFRNTRDALSGFPRRRAHPVGLMPREGVEHAELQERLLREFDLETEADRPQPDYDYKGGPRIRWLADLLRRWPQEKFLLICRTPAKVLAIADALAAEMQIQLAVFHEGLTLVQRDRQGAWFADPEGARVLVCSEIGSEGRNFQFAHHLVLFDLPLDPELLEQRIGRLDRIGQTEDIKIHLPYLRGSSLEMLQRWHHEGLDGVEHSLRGGSFYFDTFGKEIIDLCRTYHTCDPEVLANADRKMEEVRVFRDELEERIRRGQDSLLSLNSFRAEPAGKIVSSIQELDADSRLVRFMAQVFEQYGVEQEDLGQSVIRLSPGSLLLESFPGLPSEGVRVTFSRQVALVREDVQFLSWDHPMVRGSLELLLGSGKGNASFTVWPGAPGGPGLLLEAVYVLECVAPAHLHVDRFLPPTPIRVVVDPMGSDRTDDFPSALLSTAVRDEPTFRLEENPAVLQNLLPHMLLAARNKAREERPAQLEKGLTQAHHHLDGEARRLRDLRKINSHVRDEEIHLAEKQVHEVLRHIRNAHLRLDSIRLVLCG